MAVLAPNRPCSVFPLAPAPYYTLVELHGDLFSRNACPLEGAFFVAVDETIVSAVNGPKRRASPRSNYNDQHPLAERPKCSTRVSVED